MKLWLCFVIPLFFLAHQADAKIAQCYMAVEGNVYINGPCRFESGDNGSFGIASMDGTWFASVSIIEAGWADGWWNGDRADESSAFGPASHAHSPTGYLMRDDACWENRTFSICAW